MRQGTAMREQLVDHYDGIKFAPSKHGVYVFMRGRGRVGRLA